LGLLLGAVDVMLLVCQFILFIFASFFFSFFTISCYCAQQYDVTFILMHEDAFVSFL